MIKIFGYGVAGVVLLAGATSAQAQTVDEIVQRQLGQLMLANANCSASTASLQADLQKARTEIEDLKKKLPAAPAPAK